MIPNVWLLDEENPKNNTENLKLVSPAGLNKQLPLKNNPVEMDQESKKDF